MNQKSSVAQTPKSVRWVLTSDKLHPDHGHPRHPWVEKQNAFMDSEGLFKDPDERLAAMRSYYGLCTWLDVNVGQLLEALSDAGLTDKTTVVYTSDHGDNVGARGLWGKSNMYEESAAIPMIMAGPDVPVGTCDTPVSLLDLSVTIAAHFGAKINAAEGTEDLNAIAATPTDADRIVFSEYHAAGAVSGAFMLRKGRWKLIHYVGFPDELFDLQDDPEELLNRATNPACADILKDLHVELRAICDPIETDALAFRDQADLIAGYGGRDAALRLGAPGATPPPEAVT